MIRFDLRNAILIFLASLATLLSLWSFLIANKHDPRKTINQSDPDAFMENVIAIIMNKEGHPSLKIVSPKVTHYPLNNSMYIEKPHVTLFRKSPEPWYIDSEYANTQHGTETITFVNNVVIHHPEDIIDPTTTMNTPTLTFFPDKQIAQTDDPVVITQPDVVVKAIGMLANLDEGTVKLLSKTEGDYAPHT